MNLSWVYYNNIYFFIFLPFIPLFSGNYYNFDEKLNVVRVEDLMEDLFASYVPNSENIFFSIDVKSMFDEIPVRGVKEIVKHRLHPHFKHEDLKKKETDYSINSNILCELISLDSDLFDYFRYISPASHNSQPLYYRQRKGIPMGGNTSNLYADLYMSYHISRVSAALKELGVLLIRKYIDDFLLYAPQRNVDAIMEVIRKQTRLEYTCELPENGTIPYLDVLVRDHGDHITTTW